MSHPISTHRKEVCSMSEQFIYQSVFAPYFKDFLAMKEKSGFRHWTDKVDALGV